MQEYILDALKNRQFELPNACVMEIVEVLFSLGGAGHRKLVLAEMAHRRGVSPTSVEFQNRVLKGFAAGSTIPKTRGRKPILVLPFGEGSHRWALDIEAYGVLYRNSVNLPETPPRYRPAMPDPAQPVARQAA